MIVLDTNVLSALMREAPITQVLAWLDLQPRLSVWTSAITVMELRYGIELLASGRNKRRLAQAMEQLIVEKLGARIAPFDTAAAEQAARLMAARERAGHPGEVRDTMIAGIVLANHASLATRNTRHFADLSVPVVNPWAA
ncbi:MAG TPA: type II toxin-antitoxin system VapC family toxin [Rhizomicrobium sp.]|nr:type II toxin-antitoxin system VapC family toxin [Rhizomicrobium sp.]